MTSIEVALKLKNSPLLFANLLWPHVRFFKQQIELINSVRDNDETFVVAGNQLGKDFTAAFICLWYFITRSPVRIVTTSVADRHLIVLWGEIGRFIHTAKRDTVFGPLLHNEGGPLIFNHHDIRKVVLGQKCQISYLIGQVSEKGEKMSGHHALYNLVVGDESSGIDDLVYNRTSEWAKKKLFFGNPHECQNFFRKACDPKIPGSGNIPAPDGSRYYRKIIQIKAVDSPNVRLGLAEQKWGKTPSTKELIPGVMSWDEYLKRRTLLDPVRQCVGLDAEWYQGAEILLFPPEWLNRAEQLARDRRQQGKTKWMGVDPAEGGDKTCWAIVDSYGLIKLLSLKTPDTSFITGQTIALMKEYNIAAENVAFDRGGGGKEHADRLRYQGHNVRTVAFGESLVLDIRRVSHSVEVRKDNREERYEYKNRRAQMYGDLSEQMDPDNPLSPDGFTIPAEYTELRRQLSIFPKLYDDEGRRIIPPKQNPKDPDDPDTLVKMIGHSPDEADSLVLAVHARLHKPRQVVLRGI